MESTTSRSNFEPGQTVYSADGFAFEFVGTLAGINFVRDIYEDPHYGYTDYEPRAHRAPLFAKDQAPRQKRDEEFAAAQERLAEVRKEEAEARESLRALTAELEEAAKKHDSFRVLLDYLDGKITHVVVDSGYRGFQITTLDDFYLREEDDWGRRDSWPRAIGLFAAPNPKKGRSGKKVTWEASRYSDGSGDWTKIYPCRSEQEARDIVASLLESELKKWRNGKSSDVARLIKDHPWLELPSDWLEEKANERIESLKLERAKSVHQRRKSADRIAEIDAELSAVANTEVSGG